MKGGKGGLSFVCDDSKCKESVLFEDKLMLVLISTCMYMLPIVQKTATAVAFVKDGRGLINVNGAPIENVEPELLRYKILEPVLLLGQETFSKVSEADDGARKLVAFCKI